MSLKPTSSRLSPSENDSSLFPIFSGNGLTINSKSLYNSQDLPENISFDSVNDAQLSKIELEILRSTTPINFESTNNLTVLGQRGIWLNKEEINSWKGNVPLSSYKIHDDPNPKIIHKRFKKQIQYVQKLAVVYLKPPTPPEPGEIIINIEPDKVTSQAPPVIIRQHPPRSQTPKPLIIREAPLELPQPIGPKLITISGKRLPPPPRKVIIERLAPLPQKPQSVIIERWLPYNGSMKQRVIVKKAPPVPQIAPPRNVIVQWEAPTVKIRQEVNYLGIIRADPAEYVKKYGSSLTHHSSLPQYFKDIKTLLNVDVLAADSKITSPGLEGQLEGFEYGDLDKEDLSEYREYLHSKGFRSLKNKANNSSSLSSVSVANNIFELVDGDKSGWITSEEAETILFKLNACLRNKYKETEIKKIVSNFNRTRITKEQFMTAFAKLSS